MERINVQNLLQCYRANKARAAHIEVRLSEIEALIEELRAHAAYYLTSTTPAYSATPGGGKVESKVEKIAVMLADGRSPGELGEIEKEKAELIEELRCRRHSLRYVDGWLLVLNPKQRFVVQGHILEGKTWRDVIEDYRKEYGIYLSDTGIRSLCRQALRMIYDVAK